MLNTPKRGKNRTFITYVVAIMRDASAVGLSHEWSDDRRDDHQLRAFFAIACDCGAVGFFKETVYL